MYRCSVGPRTVAQSTRSALPTTMLLILSSGSGSGADPSASSIAWFAWCSTRCSAVAAIWAGHSSSSIPWKLDSRTARCSSVKNIVRAVSPDNSWIRSRTSRSSARICR